MAKSSHNRLVRRHCQQASCLDPSIEAKATSRDPEKSSTSIRSIPRRRGKRIEARVGGDGRVLDASVLRSIPELDQAALDAVKQWEFTPTLVNGVPTPVTMTTTIQFSLPN
jgi:TonB family protein